jgi:hypothetical protein
VIAWLNANAGAVTAFATLVLVGLTALYVYLTNRIAQGQLSQAELFRALITEYSQPAMSDALETLDQWGREHDKGDDALTEAAQEWAARLNYDLSIHADGETEAQRDEDAHLNSQRRLVAHWHQKVAVLVRHGLFSPAFVKDFRHWGAWPLVLRILRALDIAHGEMWSGSRDRAIRAYDEMDGFFGPNAG